MKIRHKLLSLLLVLSLVCSMNPIFKPIETVQAAEVETVEVVEPIKWDDYDDLELWDDIYDDMTYERWWQGPEPAPKIEVKEPPKNIYLGEFKITYYCPCYECSEGHGHNTATGKRATEGRTIAVDPRVIPYGTRVLINGHEYVAEDCGGKIKQQKIDIFLESHAETERRGIDWYDVWILRE